MTAIESVQLGQRLLLGSFFVVSGAHKLLVPEVHRRVVALFRAVGVESPLVDWGVPAGEFLGGAALVLGLLTPVAALGLMAILAGAIYLDVWRADVVAKNPRDPSDWAAKFLYCSEVQMMWVLASVLLLGSGPWSADHVVALWLAGGG